MLPWILASTIISDSGSVGVNFVFSFSVFFFDLEENSGIILQYDTINLCQSHCNEISYTTLPRDEWKEFFIK